MNPDSINGSEAQEGLSGPVLALSRFYAAFNNRDLDGMARNWAATEDAAMDNPLGGIKRGWNEIRAVYERIFSGPARVFVEFHDYTIHEANDLFYAVGRERGTFTLGGSSIPLAIRTSRIFRKIGSEWKQVHHHGSIEDPALLGQYQAAVRTGRIEGSAPPDRCGQGRQDMQPLPGRADEVWKTEALVKTFLEEVRGGIPLYQEQLGIMMRMITAWEPGVQSFLDLGAGDGILGRAIALQFPKARGVVLDFSEPMIGQARKKNADLAARMDFLLEDYSAPSWTQSVLGRAPFDVIVSGFSIHHQTDERKRALYAELFGLLAPGGLFLNMEHVASASGKIESCFEETFVDSLHQFHRAKGSLQTRKQVADEFYGRNDKAANILAPVEQQCEWLRAIGFEDVDCYFKVFELALFGGRKPAKE